MNLIVTAVIDLLYAFYYYVQHLGQAGTADRTYTLVFVCNFVLKQAYTPYLLTFTVKDHLIHVFLFIYAVRLR